MLYFPCEYVLTKVTQRLKDVESALKDDIKGIEKGYQFRLNYFQQEWKSAPHRRFLAWLTRKPTRNPTHAELMGNYAYRAMYTTYEDSLDVLSQDYHYKKDVLSRIKTAALLAIEHQNLLGGSTEVGLSIDCHAMLENL